MCAEANRAESMVPFAVDPADQSAMLNRLVSLSWRQVRQLRALAPPGAVAIRYAQLERDFQSVTEAMARQAVAVAGNDRLRAVRAAQTFVTLAEAANVRALESGFPTCAQDVESVRFTARTARERLGGELDMACGPAVSTDVNVRTDEAAVGDELRARRITPSQAKADLVSELLSAADATQRAALRIRAIARAHPENQNLVRFADELGMNSAGFRSEALTIGSGAQVAPAMLERLSVLAQRAARYAISLDAAACVTL
jgi:hypothetical protein